MNSNRNGYDSICFALSIVAVTLLVLSTVIDDEIYRMLPVFLAGGALAYLIFRMLSTNVARRRYEADRFSSIFGKKNRNSNSSTSYTYEQPREKKEKDMYRRFKCPKCGTVCRVPKGKGKIRITCPNCKEQFVKKS